MPKNTVPGVPAGLDTSELGTDNARRVLIVEDRAIHAEGLRMIVESGRSFKVAAVVPDREAALKACKQDGLAAVLVSGVCNQGGGYVGPHRAWSCPSEFLRLCEELRSGFPAIHVLAIVPPELLFPHAVWRLTEASVAGCLDMDSGYTMLHDSLERVASGLPSVSPAIEALRFKYYNDLRTNKGQPASRKLSTRELDVGTRLVRVRSAKLVADELGLSELTVCTHRKNIFRKAGVHCVAELEKWLWKTGVLGPQ